VINYFRRLAYNAYRRLETRRHRLLYLFLEITRRCNLQCLHCGSDCGRDSQGEELTTDSWLRVVDHIRENFGADVMLVLTGGEPLMHPELARITEHIDRQGMPWGVVTNGQLLTQERLDALTEHDIRSITISLDGPAELHDRLRNRAGSFEETVAAMHRIGRSEIPLSDVVTCVHPGNLERLDETAEIILDSGMKAWRLFRIFPSGRAAENRALDLDFDQSWEMVRWIERNRKRLKRRGLSVGLSCEGYLPFKLDRRVRDMPFFCRAGINFGAILADGTVTGCSNNHASFYQGNILENNFRYLWENRFEPFRKRAWLANTTCADCSAAGECRGGSIHLWQLGERSPAFCYYCRTDRS